MHDNLFKSRMSSPYTPGKASPELQKRAISAIKWQPIAYYKKNVHNRFSQNIFYNKHIGYAYCTSCEKEIPCNPDYRHNTSSICPRCHKVFETLCITRFSDGRQFVKEAHVEYMQKGKTRGSLNSVIAKVRQVFSLEGGMVKTEYLYTLCSVLVILPDNKRVRFQYDKNYYQSNRYNFGSAYAYYWGNYIGKYCPVVPFSVVKGTVAEKYYDCLSQDEQNANYLSYMTDDCEKLFKAGLHDVAKALMNLYERNSCDRKVTVPRLKSGPLHKVLSVTPAYLDLLRSSEGTVSDLQAAMWLSVNIPSNWIPKGFRLSDLPGKIQKMQHWKIDIARAIKTYGDYLPEYIDYLDALTELGEYSDENKYRYPKNLIEAHDAVVERLLVKRDREYADHRENRDEKIRKFAELLSLFTYSDDKYIVRPLRSVFEMYDESRLMSHCIKTYTGKYSKKECALFTVRSVDAPDHPLVSVEIRHDNTGWFRVQARAAHNAAPTTEIEEFLKEWLNYVREVSLKKENQKTVAQLYAA